MQISKLNFVRPSELQFEERGYVFNDVLNNCLGFSIVFKKLNLIFSRKLLETLNTDYVPNSNDMPTVLVFLNQTVPFYLPKSNTKQVNKFLKL